MKLYTIPRNSYILILPENGTSEIPEELSFDNTFLFDHLDGMYSYCEHASGDVVHVAAWQEVIMISKSVGDALFASFKTEEPV